PVPAAGVPRKAPTQPAMKQPNELPGMKERPLGSVLLRLAVPLLANMPNEPAVPAVNVAIPGLVTTGVFTTVMVYVAAKLTEAKALGITSKVNVPQVPSRGPPLSTAGPLLLSFRRNQAGGVGGVKKFHETGVI